MSDQHSKSRFVLALDVANRVTQFGLVCDGELLDAWSLSTPPHITADEAQFQLGAFLQVVKQRNLVSSDCSLSDFDAILSCVVPDLNGAWVEALLAVCTRKPLVVGPGLKTGIHMRYNDPSELGSDRIASIVAAKEKYQGASVVVNCDTVITYQVLDAEGSFVGGLITPGLDLSARSLAQEAARLPIVNLEGHVAIPGKNTPDSLKAGIIYGEKARIQGLVRIIWDKLGYETQVILAGKDASTLASLLDIDVIIDADLVLQGLSILAVMNRK